MLGSDVALNRPLGELQGVLWGWAQWEWLEVDLGKGRQASVNEALNQCSCVLWRL